MQSKVGLFVNMWFDDSCISIYCWAKGVTPIKWFEEKSIKLVFTLAVKRAGLITAKNIIVRKNVLLCLVKIKKAGEEYNFPAMIK